MFLWVCVLWLDVPLMFDVHSRKKKRESVMTTNNNVNNENFGTTLHTPLAVDRKIFFLPLNFSPLS